ncbi:chemotaxis protein CheB [Xanthomonas campestris pv. raphani]|uniref:chemotaxis protein CheB n=1 Tax=Xanthomonas campestris TaxID=339 RepID=UPI00096FF770|nr:chemotaxis protein CheB [Xanthomonas campestris]MEA9755636.1 chemotaxis protein CheB [Xanthomonas campestris pv. raphani]MEA9764402.1 chemotaxis protein CheB [Xanthomonas campestris pv. raphani]MEA9815779.1 chemotaxis protein CheB [Xanthomonas campestris pv. raphani]MEA9823787.1 chemotaxis protein CheB [Xanthomonas campestris pv. raphani]MEA9851576.1 chemotaxis protein CheB [Xanthomonas campestris pv. raphani]
MGTPVALLGRPGQARERLREALTLAGAQVVLEDEPAAVDVQMLRDAEPVAVLVALEPAIEDALEALEPAFNMPGVTVIFDEAELTVRREGWEAQRWVRHLAAKLHGHADVLPPGTESEPSLQPEPGLAFVSNRQDSDLQLDQHLEAAAHAFERVPGDAMFSHVAEAAPAVSASTPALGDSSTWGLVDEVAVVVRPRSEPDMAALSTGSLSLVDLDQAAASEGAVLVMAGIGGPDAIRRLLAALPPAFPRPLLVRMALDGGQYGNLVRQMGRVSALPVELGEIGQPIEAGKVYVLSDEVGVQQQAGALAFAAQTDPAALVAALPPADSAVLMLSGANEALVEATLALAGQGGWVAGQSADGCYDPAAAARLAQQGMLSGDPAQLAQALAQRWPA